MESKQFGLNLKNMKRLKLEVGDVFEVPFDNGKKGFFQYVNDDKSLMNSNVIKCFNFEISSNEIINIETIINKPVKFYTHCMVHGGYKNGLWNKIGNSITNIDCQNLWFRDTYDEGDEKSYNWYIWKLNEQYIKIGELIKEYKSYHLGGVFHPIDVIKWMITGKNIFEYSELYN